MDKMKNFNHWLREGKKVIFAPRVVSDIKSGLQRKFMVAAAGSSSECASCGSGCNGIGCSGIGCGVA